MPQPVFDLLDDLGTTLTALDLRWYLFDAQAAVVHGSTRLSADVDATVFVNPSGMDALLERLAAQGIVPRSGDFRQVAAKHRVLLLWHEPTGMPLDLVLGGPGIETTFCARARAHDLGGTKVPVISAEDLVASKILAGRAKDIDDVQAILEVGRDTVDITAVRSLLRQFEQALDRSDLLPVLERMIPGPASE